MFLFKPLEHVVEHETCCFNSTTVYALVTTDTERCHIRSSVKVYPRGSLKRHRYNVMYFNVGSMIPTFKFDAP